MHGYYVSDFFKNQNNFSYFSYDNPFIKPKKIFVKPVIIIPTYQNFNLISPVTINKRPILSDLSPIAPQWSPVTDPSIKFGSYVDTETGLSPAAPSYVPVNLNGTVNLTGNVNKPFFTTGDDILLE